MLKTLKILIAVCVAGLFIYAAYSFFGGRQKTVSAQEVVETFTLDEILFSANYAPEKTTAQPAVVTLLMRQIEYALDDSAGKSRKERAAEAFTTVNEALRTWPSPEAEVLLAQLAAGLTASAGEYAGETAVALVKHATAEQRPQLIATIALTAAALEAGDAVTLAAVSAAPSVERNDLNKIASAPMTWMKEDADAELHQIVKAFTFLNNRFNLEDQPSTFMMDSDGGEPPAVRR